MFKECTFRPKIKELPSYYGASNSINTPFHDRVIKWQVERELERMRKLEETKQYELEGELI